MCFFLFSQLPATPKYALIHVCMLFLKLPHPRIGPFPPPSEGMWRSWCTLAATRANCASGCVTKSVASKLGDAITSPALVIRPHWQCCVPSLLPQFQRDVGKLERVQQRATKTFRGLENFTCEEGKTKGIGFFST